MSGVSSLDKFKLGYEYVEDDVVRDIVRKLNAKRRKQVTEQLQAIISKYLVLEYIYT